MNQGYKQLTITNFMGDSNHASGGIKTRRQVNELQSQLGFVMNEEDDHKSTEKKTNTL